MEDSPQLAIEPTGSNRIENDDTIRKILEAEPETEVQAFVSGLVWVSDPAATRGQPARVTSWDPKKPPPPDNAFGRPWQSTNEDLGRAAFITRQLGSSLGLFLDDEIIVVSPRTRLTPFGPAPVWRKYTITRILPSGIDRRQPDIMIPFAEASKLFATGGHAGLLDVYMPPDRTDDVKSMLRERFPDLIVMDWKEINRPLFLALRLERVVMFATISLIIFVAALNLVSSLTMLVVEKRAQVGVLRTLGSSGRSIRKIFLSVGIMIGLIGTALGNLVGVGVSFLAEKYHFVPLPREIYFVSHVPFSIDAVDVVAVNVIAILLSLCATWYPARAAALLDPIAAIRDQ